MYICMCVYISVCVYIYRDLCVFMTFLHVYFYRVMRVCTGWGLEADLGGVLFGIT